MFQDTVVSLDISEEDGRKSVKGVRTALGIGFSASKVVLTAGTFLNGMMHFGRVKVPGGRISENAVEGMTGQLKSLGFVSGRMKTGTPVRLDGRSIDYGLVETGFPQVLFSSRSGKDACPSGLLHSAYLA